MGPFPHSFLVREKALLKSRSPQHEIRCVCLSSNLMPRFHTFHTIFDRALTGPNTDTLKFRISMPAARDVNRRLTPQYRPAFTSTLYTNAFAGILDNTTWNFDTAPAGDTDPAIRLDGHASEGSVDENEERVGKWPHQRSSSW